MSEKKRLYPTWEEEREYQRLKKLYGIKDSVASQVTIASAWIDPQGVDQKLALAMRDEECPHGTTGVGTVEQQAQAAQIVQAVCFGGTWHTRGCRCGGTGRRYVLDPDGRLGLRVECAGWPLYDNTRPAWVSCCSERSDCLCQGRGWTPTDNLWAWFKAVGALVVEGAITGAQYHRLMVAAFDGEEQFFNVLTGVLLKGEADDH